MLVGKESTWEEDHSNLGAGFGQLEDFCTSWVKNFDVNPHSGCSLFVRRLKDVDENGGFCQNRFSHFRICNGANFCAQEISTNQLFIRTVCLFLFLSQYINLSLSVFLSFCIFASPGCFLAAGGHDPGGLSGRTRAFNFSEQACTTDAKAEAIFSKITKIYIFMG